MKAFNFALSTFAAACLLTSVANAQSAQTFVSGTGNDANTCSRTAPCKTFAGAIADNGINKGGATVNQSFRLALVTPAPAPTPAARAGQYPRPVRCGTGPANSRRSLALCKPEHRTRARVRRLSRWTT